MRGLTLMRFLAAVNGLINVAGGKAPAAHSAYVISFLRGTFRNDKGELEPFLMSDGIGVGWGARPYADGTDAVYFVAQENYPVEFLETGYPVRLRATASSPTPAARAGIAAAAASCASTTSWPRRRCWRCASTASRTRPGASPAAWRAAPAASWSIPAPTTSACWRRLSDGNVLQARRRAPHRDRRRRRPRPSVRPAAGEGGSRTWLGGFVTADARQRLYGVALADGAIDKAATARLRARRPATKAFHRHAYVDSLG